MPAVTSSEYGQRGPSALAYFTERPGKPLQPVPYSLGWAMPSLFGSVQGHVWLAFENGLTLVTRSMPTCSP